MADKAKPHHASVHQANRSSHNRIIHTAKSLNAGLNQTAHYRSPLRKAPQIGNMPGLLRGSEGLSGEAGTNKRQIFITQSYYSFGKICQLAPIAIRRPLVTALWQEFIVILERIMLRIEEVFAVQLHKSEET